MDEVGRRHVVVIVPNLITGDSRVIKTALAASRAGWRVTLLGQARRRRQETRLGDVRVVRVPIQRANHDAYVQRMRAVVGRRSPVAYRGSARRDDAATALGRYRDRRRAAVGGLRRIPVEADLLARRAVHALRSWGAGTEIVREPDVPLGEVAWRRDWPILLDWSEAFVPVLRELEPDLIHANDAIMIGVVAEAVRQLQGTGRSVSWLYDAHEHVSAVDWGSPVRSAAFRSYEREYIHDADAVVTVSEELAGIIRDEHGLPDLPVVVRNAPIRHVEVAERPDLRAAAGVPAGVPLIVYSGYLEPRRGVGTVVDALTMLPEVHLALVTSAVPTGGTLGEVLTSARENGVEDRVHVAPYVDPYQVPAYLAGADVGIFPGLRHDTQEDSLPTKIPEYLHARLPLIVSDLRTMAAFVRDTGVGEVFTAGDPESFAVVAKTLLAGPDDYRARITDELLDDLSWEVQSQVLIDLYARLVGRRPHSPGEPVPWESVESTVDGERIHIS